MATRGGHVGKSRAQQRQYVEKVVLGDRSSLTAPTPLGDDGAATDSLNLSDNETQIVRPSRRRTSRQPTWYERHKEDIKRVGFPILTAAILGGAGLLLVNLNREVGELQQTTQDTARQISDVRASAVRTEDRLDSELRRLRERFDDLRDRLFPPRAPSKN